MHSTPERITDKVVRDTYLRRRRKRRLDSGWNGVFTDELTGSVTLTTSVATRQCYQQNGRGILFEGTYSLDADPPSIAYSVDGGPARELVNQTIGGGNWSGYAPFDIDKAQGDLVFRPINGSSVTVTGATVANITVTDIILYMGQSGAADQATNAQSYSGTSYTMTRFINGIWSDILSANALWVHMANLLDAHGIPPAFVRAEAAGGSGFVSAGGWNEDEPNYNNAEADILAAATGGYAAIYLDLGQYDMKNGQTKAGYKSALSAMKSALAADCPDISGVPWFLSIIGELDTVDSQAPVRDAIMDLVADNPDIYPRSRLHGHGPCR